ncbi:MAG: hypothetical protein LBK73_02055 [Treponema sp.]|jgi:hypothetical protein|nr:hypothetical protein [Treponema sp.]
MNGKFFKVVAAGIVLAMFLLACENSGLGDTGLGGVVDTRGPTASIVDPLPGSFIKGAQVFKIQAEDDVALAKHNPVAIAFVNDLAASVGKDPWIPAFYNASDKLYYVSIDTISITNSVDGQYSFRIKAWDEAGYAPFESSDLVYSVKNGLPTVEMLIPKLDWANIETDPENAPEVLNSGFLSGVASDLQGVEAGYPRLKLWKDGEPEPEDWKIPPVPAPNEGGKSFAFRYYTSSNGNETSDMMDLLTDGLYHIKFQIKDINGLEADYPETGSALISITSSPELPKIVITKLPNQQQNKSFVIRAEVTHSVGVLGQKDVFNQFSTNLTFTKNDIVYGLPWKSIALDETHGERKVVFESYPITPGQALDNLVIARGGGEEHGEQFAFPDDTYDFDVEAISVRSDKATTTYANIIFDTVAPSVEVTNITPISTKSGVPDGEYVNGKVTVDFTATDGNGLGSENDGKRRLKYLVSQTRQTGFSPDDLYEKGEWFDSYPSNGPVVISSAKRMTVNTAYIHNGQPLYADGEPLYIYLIAKDKAGNANFVEKTVNIDQATDKPVFTFTNEQIPDFAAFGETPPPYQTANVMSGANASISGTVEDDDALHVDVDTGGGLQVSIWKEEKGKTPASVDTYFSTIGLAGAKSAKFNINLSQMGMATNEAGEKICGDADSLPEGGYYFTLKMSDLASAKDGLDAATKETEVYYVAVDMKDPEIAITSSADNAFVDSKSALTIEGAVVEANFLSLKISAPHAVGVTPEAGDYKTVAVNGDGGWTVTFANTEISHIYRQFTLEAKDRFGRTTEKLLTVRVDNEAPVVNLIKFPVENTGSPPAVSSVTSADLSINGTAIDGPAGSESGVEQVFYQITNSAAPPPQPANYDSPDGWKMANGGAQWSAVETLSSTQQGSRYLHVFARDAVHNTGAIKSTRFEVDTENPEIGDVKWTGTVPVGATSYVNGAFALNFAAFDSNALHSSEPVSITRKASGGQSVNVTPVFEKSGYYKGDFSDAHYGSYAAYNEKNLWRATLQQTAGAGEGELESGSYEYTLLVRDAAGKTTTRTFTIAVDITPPEIEVTGVTPTVAKETGDTVNGIVRVNFNASDNEGIGEDSNDGSHKREIKYLISTNGSLTDAAAIYKYDSAGEGAVFVDAFVNGQNLTYNDGKSGSVKVKPSESKSLYIDTQKLSDKADAYLYIAAQDRAGNFGWSRTTLRVDQSADTPSITLTSIDKDVTKPDDLAGNAHSQNIMRDARISGSFADDDAIDTGSARLVIWKEGREDDKKTIALTGLSGAGTVNFDVKAQTLGAAFGEAELGEGVYCFTLEVSDTTSGDFKITPTTTQVGPFWFAVDTSTPKITVTSPTRGSYQSETFTLSGIVSDTSNKQGLPPVLTFQDPNDAEPVQIEFKNEDYDAQTGEWKWTHTANGINEDKLNGKTVRIVAKDRFGKETTEDFTVEFDNTAPVVTIKQPASQNIWFEGVTMAFNGSLSDNNGKVLQKVYYFILKHPGIGALPNVPLSPLDTENVDSRWREASITGNTWSVMVDLNDDDNALEGANVLYVIGYDEAGNGPDKNATYWADGAPMWSSAWGMSDSPNQNTAASMITFYIDRVAPVVELQFYKASDTNEPLADKSFIKEGFVLKGAVTDTNKLDSLVVKQNGVQIALTESELVKTNDKEWTVNLTGLPRNPDTVSEPLAEPEGVYVYTIEVKDASAGLNHDVTLTRTITVDTSGPEVTVQSPGEDEPFNSASITVAGSADDTENGAGVSRVYFHIGADEFDVPTGVISSEWWTLASGTTQWSKTNVQIGSIEGMLKLTAFAEDTLGNRGEKSVQLFYVDASNPEILDEKYPGVTTDKYANGKFTLEFTAFDSNTLNEDDSNLEKGKLAGVVITRTSGGAPVDVFNSYEVSGQFAELVGEQEAYTDDDTGNMLTIKGTYSGAKHPSIVNYSKEKIWGVALPQNDSTKSGTSGLLADGIYDYLITVTDETGKTTSKTVTITVDTKAPSIDVTKFTALASHDLGGGEGILDYVNGVIQFAASVSDENGLATSTLADPALQYWILPSTSQKPTWETEGGTPFERSAMPLIDTAAEPFDQTGTKVASSYTLYIGAKDKAGNTGVASYNTDADHNYSFVINQETDKPFVAITSPDADAYVGSSHLVQGVLTDDDGFKAGDNSNRIKIEYSKDGEEGEWKPVTGTITTTKITDFEYNFTYSVADIGDSPVWLRVTVMDDETKKLAMSGASAEQATDIEFIHFIIDSTPPKIAVKTQDNTFNKDFTLSGNFVELNYKEGSLKVGVNGGAKTDAPVPTLQGGANNTWDWTYDVELSVLQDGVNTIEFEVYDMRDQVGRISVVVNKDTVLPTAAISEFKNFVTVVTDGETVNYVNGVVRFTVIASDNIGVKETRYWLLPKSTDAATETNRVAALETAMSATGYDTAASASAENNPANGTVFTETQVFIDTAKGTDNQATPSLIADKTEYTLYVGVSDKAGNVSVYTYKPTEGKNYSFKVGQSTDTPVWTFDNLSANPEENFIAGGVLSGTVTDDDGFAAGASLTIEFRPYNENPESGWVAMSTQALLTKTLIGAREIRWTTPLPNNITDGVYQIRLTAIDDGVKKVGDEGNVLFKGMPMQFTVDLTPPVPAITNIGGTEIADAGDAPNLSVKTAPSIAGTLVENNPLSLVVTVKDSVGATVASKAFGEGTDEGTLEKEASGKYTWSWNEGISSETFKGLPDGLYTVIVETIDRVNTQAHTGTVQHVFYKDTSAPSVAFSNLSKTVEIDRELMLEVADNSGDSSGYTGWSKHGLGDLASPADIHTAAVTEYKEIKASITDIIRNTDTNLRGTFTDAYSSVAAFEYRFDTDPYDETAPDDPNKTLWRSGAGKLGTQNAKTTSWLIPIPAKNEGDNPVQDGVRLVTIRVRDAHGNEGVTSNIAFHLDREAPAFDLTKYDGGASGNDEAGRVYSGNGLDDDGDIVFILKGHVEDANITEMTVTGVSGILPVVSVNETESAKDFTYTVTKEKFKNLGDGSHTITLIARDIASNATQTTWIFVKDTTPPENTFLNMGDTSENTEDAPFIFGDGSAKIMGSTIDATSGLESVTYTLEAKGETGWSDSTSIKTNESLTAVPTWNIVLGGNGGLGLADGYYRIQVTATDNAKKTGGAENSNPNKTVNESGSPEWIYFVLDTVNPNLTVEPTNQYYNRDIPLKGTVSDTNGIEKVEVSFALAPASKQTIETGGINPDSGGWSLTMPIKVEGENSYTLGQGKQTINITAYDNAGHTTTLQREFTLDTTPPNDVVVKQPNESGKRVIGELTVSGVASDNNSVSRIFYQIGKPDTTPTATITEGQAYTIVMAGDFNWVDYGAVANEEGVSFIATGTAPIDGGESALAWKDTNLHSSGASESTPTTIQWSGGVYAWNVKFTELKAFVNGGAGDTYGVKRYQYTSSSDDTLIKYDEGNTSGLTPGAPENNVWDIPINVLAFDIAGNATRTAEFYITVDPHMDKATTEIMTPDGKQAVGGTVRLTGIASDNDKVNSVWVRVSGSTHNDNDVWKNPGDHTAGYQDWAFLEWANDAENRWYDWSLENEAAETSESTQGPSEGLGIGWHQATLQGAGGGSVNWYINLNANGMLNPAEGNNDRTVYIEVFARDTKDNEYSVQMNSVNGYITRYILTFSSNVPIIENIMVTPQDGSAKDYSYQMQISRTVAITADVKDSDGISAITIQPTGGSQLSVINKTNEKIDGLTTVSATADKIITAGGAITAGKKYYVADSNGFTSYNGWTPGAKTFYAGENGISPGGTLYEADDNGYFIYHVKMTLASDGDTSSYKDGTGVYGLTLHVADDAAQQLTADSAMSFQIDNFYPRAAYTASVTAVGDYTLRGTANDAPASGSVQGLESVTVYFSRTISGATTYYMPMATNNGGMTTHAVSSDPAAYTTVWARKWDGATLGNLIEVVYPQSGYGIRIDHDESATGEQDGDNFVEYWYDNAGSEKTWGATFDSTAIGDGRITAHYITEDRAGNKTYSEQDIYFQNNAPSIISLDLGTPLFGVNIGTKQVSDRYLDAIFTVRNSAFQIGLNVSGGNGQKHYRVSYLNRSEVPVSIIKKGFIYTVASANAGFDFKTIGAKDNIVGAPFVAARDENGLNGATVFEYTSSQEPPTLVKQDGGVGIGSEASVSVNISFTDADFGADNGKIPDSGAYAVVKAGGTLIKGRKYRIEELGNTPWSSLAGLVNAEKGSTFIPAENKVMTGTGVAVTSNDRYFSIKVWDTTLAGSPEEEQLSDFVMLAARVENEDSRPPETRLYDVNPKSETTLAASVSPVVSAGGATTVQNTTKGSLYMLNGKISGHIEPRDGKGDGSTTDAAKASIWLEQDSDEYGNLIGDGPKPSGFAADTVSGVIMLRGQARDDQRITALYLDFGGTNRLKMLEADTDGTLKRAGSLTTNDVGLYQTLDLDGHYVEWTYRWDAGTLITGVTTETLGAVTVVARAEDKKAAADNAGASNMSDTAGVSADRSNAANNADYNSIGLSLAPYITTLTRFKDSSGTMDTNKAPVLRSRNGWFSFRRSLGDAERMQIEGFNLGDATASRSVTINGGDNVMATQNSAYYYIDVPAAARSGAVVYTAGGVTAVNNRNNNANSWNTIQEALAGNESSSLWNDDRAVHLFDSHNLETGDNQGHFRNPTVVGSIVKPAMTINPTNGQLWGSWSSYLINGSTYNNYGTGGSNMPAYYSQNNGTTVAIPLTWNSDPPEDTDISWDSTNTRVNMVVLENYMQTGYDIGGLNYLNPTNRANNTNHKGTWIERFLNADNQQLMQFINPRIANNGAVSHITYYDAKYQLLRYWNTTKGAPTGTTAGNLGIPGVIVEGTRTAGTGTDAGNYSAIDVNSAGIPVIAYLVQNKASGTEKLRYAYGNMVNAETFTTADIPTTGVSTAGRYVSMRINKTTNVMHIAFMDSENGDLVYVKGTPQGTTGAYAFGAPVIVDSVGNVGKWADIAVDGDGNPVISYLDQGGIDSRTGLKMAFPTDADFAEWEYVTLPGRYVVNDVRTQVECDTRATGVRAWNAAFAYVSDDYYRISYYVK